MFFRLRSAIPAVPGIALAVLVAALLWHTFLGDPSIYLPFARNLAHGQFFRFNPDGAFSTGIASPIWTALLAIPFVLGLGVMSVKVLALAVTVAAVLVSVGAARAVSGSSLAAAVGGLFVAGHLVYWGGAGYDSAVAVILSAATVIAGLRLERARSANGALERRAVWPLAIVWGLLPLARADLTILIPLQFAALCAGGVVRSRRDLATMALPMFVALLPAIAYYAAAFIDTGSYSVSSATRTYDQKLTAKSLGPVLYSTEALAYLRTIGYAIVVACAGCAVLASRPKTRWIGIYCVAGIGVYALVLVFFPVTFYVERYSLPAIPLLGIGIASALAALPLQKPLALVVFVGVLALVGLGLRDPVNTARAERAKHYTFNEITEREAARRLAAVAPHGATVLGYEVQDRWQLRPDLRLLALNGITDGHVFSYRDDMRAFLMRYRPQFWIANDPAGRIPYLRDSIIGTAYRRLRSGSADFKLAGIRFNRIGRRSRPVPPGFAGWRYIVRLRYPAA